MSGDKGNRHESESIGANQKDDSQPSSLFADAYSVGSNAIGSAAEWIDENPETATVIGIAAAAGIGYLTRGRWLPAVIRLGEEGAVVNAGRVGGYDATKAGLTAFADVARPGLQPWKAALGYADVGLDEAGTLIYRGSKAGAFTADHVLLVNGAKEADTLFRALSREGLLQRQVWERGAGSGATQFGEVNLAGPTKFLFAEGKAMELGANGRLVHLGNGEFTAMTADAAENLYKGLSIYK